MGMQHHLSRDMMGKMEIVRGHVLIIGAENSAVRRIAPILRRVDYQVLTVEPSMMVLDLLKSISFNLIIAAFPIAELAVPELARSIRSVGSDTRRAGFLLLADDKHLDAAQEYVDKGVNRVIGVSWGEARLWQAVADLLNVAPRIFLRWPVQLDIESSTTTDSVNCYIENISRSGMLLRGASMFSPGVTFSFVFTIPGHPDPIQGEAEVVRKTAADKSGSEGVGVRFLTFAEEDGQHRLDDYISGQLNISSEIRRSIRSDRMVEERWEHSLMASRRRAPMKLLIRDKSDAPERPPGSKQR